MRDRVRVKVRVKVKVRVRVRVRVREMYGGQNVFVVACTIQIIGVARRRDKLDQERTRTWKCLFWNGRRVRIRIRVRVRVRVRVKPVLVREKG